MPTNLRNNGRPRADTLAHTRYPGIQWHHEYSRRSPLLLLLATLNSWPPQLSRSFHDTEVTNSGSARAPMLPSESSIKSECHSSAPLQSLRCTTSSSADDCLLGYRTGYWRCLALKAWRASVWFTHRHLLYRLRRDNYCHHIIYVVIQHHIRHSTLDCLVLRRLPFNQSCIIRPQQPRPGVVVEDGWYMIGWREDDATRGSRVLNDGCGVEWRRKWCDDNSCLDVVGTINDDAWIILTLFRPLGQDIFSSRYDIRVGNRRLTTMLCTEGSGVVRCCDTHSWWKIQTAALELWRSQNSSPRCREMIEIVVAAKSWAWPAKAVEEIVSSTRGAIESQDILYGPMYRHVDGHCFGGLLAQIC